MVIDELVFVRDYVVREYNKAMGDTVTTTQIACALVDFDDLFPKGIGAMYRFINWMQTHGYTEHEILPTLMHDINGRNDNGFDPRTSTY